MKKSIIFAIILTIVMLLTAPSISALKNTQVEQHIGQQNIKDIIETIQTNEKKYPFLQLIFGVIIGVSMGLIGKILEISPLKMTIIYYILFAITSVILQFTVAPT